MLLIKTDYKHFTQNEAEDVPGELSAENKQELMNEPFAYNTICQLKLDKAISKWRTK